MVDEELRKEGGPHFLDDIACSAEAALIEAIRKRSRFCNYEAVIVRISKGK